jgi:PAS domain S-box-containing protein
MGRQDSSRERSSSSVELQTFREAVENAGHSIYWTDLNGTIEYVNPAFEEQTGFSPEEAVGSNANILQSGVHDDLFYERLWDTILSGDVWEGEIVNERKDGERYVVRQTISPIVDDSGEIFRFVAVNEDITELKEYHEELQRERDRFRRLLGAVPVPLVLTRFEDNEAIVERVNESFETQFGFSDRELAGDPLDQFIAPDVAPREAREINERIRQGEQVQQEVTRQTADGERRAYLLTATPLSEENPTEALGIYIDITDRKRAEEELKRKNEQLEEFAHVISHDLRNPLNVAAGHLGLISETCDSPHVRRVQNAHARMQELIDHVLELARQGRGIDQQEPVDLGACVPECWETIPTEDAELRAEVSGTVLADEERLRQLFGNLIRNAIEHAPGDDRGSGVRITIDDLPDGFYVEDDGTGIPESERESIFESGYTTSESGTGFGLSIVREIAGAHGWSVSVTDAESGGARFEFTDVEILS